MKSSSLLRMLLPAVLVVALAIPAVLIATAQDAELVASLEVLSAGVEVRRVDTENWVPINVETLIGQGDQIKTDASGSARIIFFADGTSTVLEPDTQVRILHFTGSEEKFDLSVEILFGVTRQQFGRLVESGSTYEVETPGVAMTVRGTDFSVRVEDGGRSALLTHEGVVQANASGTTSEVPPEFGVRSEIGMPLSDVVPATSFDELDAALDGCAGSIETPADVKLNVRLSPGLDAEIVGSIAPADIGNLIGATEDGAWYRIPFRSGYAWVASAGMTINVTDNCPNIAVYDYDKVEDSSRYGLFGEAETLAVVNQEVANLRSGPGTEYPRIGQAAGGDELVIIGRNEAGDWLRIRTADGQLGWVATFLVRVNSDIGFIGVVPADGGPAEPAPAATDTPDAEVTPDGTDTETE